MSAARRLSLTLGPERNAQGLTGLIFNLLLPFPLGLLKAVCYLSASVYPLCIDQLYHWSG